MKNKITPVNQEIHFDDDEIIVSKTDLKGKLVYTNDVFCRVAELDTKDAIGQAHNLIRHPDMPRVIFKLLWSTIQAGNEIFAYVKNMSKTGKFYWVIAHVTPSYDANGNIEGYHSMRRKPDPKSVDQIVVLYSQLLAEEKKHTKPNDALIASEVMLQKILTDQGKSYSEFVWSLGGAK